MPSTSQGPAPIGIQPSIDPFQFVVDQKSHPGTEDKAAPENKPLFKLRHFLVKLRRKQGPGATLCWLEPTLLMSISETEAPKPPAPIPASHGRLLVHLLRACTQGILLHHHHQQRQRRAHRRLHGLVCLSAPVTPLKSRRVRAASERSDARWCSRPCGQYARMHNRMLTPRLWRALKMRRKPNVSRESREKFW